MNINRNKPDGWKKEDLDLWFSGCINDAIKDAHDAGLRAESVVYLLRFYLRMEERRLVLPRAERWSEKPEGIGLWKRDTDYRLPRADSDG